MSAALHPVMDQALMAAAPKPLAQTYIQETPSTIEYRIEGTLEQVQCAIAGIFRDYHYVGYGTQVRDLQGMYPQDRYVALVTRHRSCE